MADDNENAFIRDLAKAQAEMDNALFDKVNPHFKSKYASLAAVRAAIKPLSKHGFAIVQGMRVQMADGHPVCQILATRLEHVSGECRTDERVIAIGTPQQMGSDETYARRRGLSALAAIASEEDDDANAAQEGAKGKSAYQARLEGFYPIAQAQIRQLPTLTALKDWWIQNQHEIKQLPPQWRELLDEEKDRRKLQLADEIGPGDMSSERLRASLVLSEEEAELIDPKDVTTDNPQAFLDDLDSQMAVAKDEHTIMEVWNEFAGIREVLPPADQDKMQMIFERHMRALKASTAVKAMRDKKK